MAELQNDVQVACPDNKTEENNSADTGDDADDDDEDKDSEKEEQDDDADNEG